MTLASSKSPGPGFFSPAVARAVPNGRLELLDIQSAWRDHAERKRAAPAERKE
jgi:hypothetical protein